MRLLITGADRALGRLAAEHLAAAHDLLLCGATSEADAAVPGYRAADLRCEAQLRALVRGVEAILHLSEFDPAAVEGPRADLEILERASLGTYRLCGAARAAGVGRIVLASTLAFFDVYPESYLIDELWRPRPGTEARQLAPFLAELVAREFAREAPPPVVCLRFGPLGEGPEQTRPADALEAFERALAAEFPTPGHRWEVYHVTSSPRFLVRNARLGLGLTDLEGR